MNFNSCSRRAFGARTAFDWDSGNFDSYDARGAERDSVVEKRNVMDRQIRATRKDREGKIIALCNPGQSWSPRLTKDVVRDINAGAKSYYVQEQDRRSYLRSVSGALQAGPDDDDTLTRLPTADERPRELPNVAGSNSSDKVRQRPEVGSAKRPSKRKA
jgi:hypothetical protein